MSESPDPAKGQAATTHEALLQIRRALESGRTQEVERLGPERREHLTALRTRNKLRKRYGTWLLALVIAQLVVVNVCFVVYAWVGKDWKIPDAVMIGFITATVVELIGVAAVVVQSLFQPDE